MQTVFVDHAADLLGVSRRTIYYWIRDGRLRTIRTLNGSQRVLIVSIETVLREEMQARARPGMRRRSPEREALAER
jgi:excisionase family DNA binding protein